MVARVEAIGDFVEQQQFRSAGQRARDEHQAAFAVGQREKTSLGERPDAEPPEQRRDATLFGGRERAHRNVGALHAGADHLVRPEIPVVVFVAVLAFRADVGDFVGDAGRRVEGLRHASGSDAVLVRVGLRPHAAREQLQQLRLAGAIAADQQPALPGPDAPGHVAQHRALAAIEIDAA